MRNRLVPKRFPVRTMFATKRTFPTPIAFARSGSQSHAASSRSILETEINALRARCEQAINALRARCEQAEEHLHQSQKMAEIGQFVTGIVHDLNNLIAGVRGNLELAQMRLAQERAAEAKLHLDLAADSTLRTIGLTQGLLRFARHQPLDLKPVHVGKLVAAMDDLIRRAAGSKIQVCMLLVCSAWRVRCDANQLEAALLNLCLNARDAMPSGGRLTIEARNAMASEVGAAVERQAVLPGEYVVLVVSDTGVGMPPDVAARACDPFFTTKPAGQGTGLGLSQVCRFARHTGGAVMIDSVAGDGTKVVVLLPRDYDSAKD